MNTKRKIKNIIGFLMITAILLSMSVSTALAEAPSNDNFADATVIDNFPFNQTVDTTEATIEPGDPISCYGQNNSVWYMYTPTNDYGMNISVNAEYDHFARLAIYRAENGGLTPIECRSEWSFSIDILFNSGMTYYFELMVLEGYTFTDGGIASININQYPLPENDDFVNAKIITELPFSDSVNTIYATTEPDEPSGCAWGAPQQSGIHIPPQRAIITLRNQVLGQEVSLLMSIQVPIWIICNM